MSIKYLIGVDIGTQGTKTSIFDLNGQMMADSFESSRLISTGIGHMEQDPDQMYFSVIHTIRDAFAKTIHAAQAQPGQIAAIGISGQMAGIIGIDARWNAVTPYDSWLDNRCSPYITMIRREAEEKVIQYTGAPVTYAHGPKILWWKYERPEAYKKIVKFVTPTTYVVGRLCGLKAEDAYIDYTHLHYSGFGDVARISWSDELLQIFDVNRYKMPTIVNPWAVIGELVKSEAAQCGLAEGTPLVAGCGDQAATSLGAGIARKGLAFDVAGTASVFSYCIDEYCPDTKRKTLVFQRSAVPGLWTPHAFIKGGGLCLRWFRDNLAGKENMANYAQLDKEAESIRPGSEGLIFVPHFDGRVCPNDPFVSGSWIGLSWAHTRAHLYRSIMEGIAYEYAIYHMVLRELLPNLDFNRVISIGGGAKSRIFTSIKADVLGLPYATLRYSDTATFGSAIIAGRGVGIYDDMAVAAERNQIIVDQITPDKSKHIEYEKYKTVYNQVFEALSGVNRSIAEIS